MLTAGTVLCLLLNRVGAFFFTTLLLPVLIRTAASESTASSGHRVRVVHTSSNAHDGMAPSAGIVWESLQKDKEKAWPVRKKMGKFQLYGQSKLVSSTLLPLFTSRPA